MSPLLHLLLPGLLVAVTTGGALKPRRQPLVWPPGRVPARASRPCPCATPDLCKPITKTTEYEVFTFMVTDKNYREYDWSRISTVILFLDAVSDEVMCYAHSKGVRVSYGVDYPVNDLTNGTLRMEWVKRQVAFAKHRFLDGVNFDFEYAISPGDKARRDGLNILVDELTAAFKLHQRHSQVTFDTPYSPHSSRAFDYPHIAATMDFILIMAYDESGSCNARANADFKRTAQGVKDFNARGIPLKKMVLGLPWYGYDYPCSTISKDNVCQVEPRCGGKQVLYGPIINSLYPTNTSGRLWDTEAVTPFFNRKDSRGVLHQTWYDDKESLGLKYKWAKQFGLRGIGMWDADCLDYSETEAGRKQRAEMWGALPVVNKFTARLHTKLKHMDNGFI